MYINPQFVDVLILLAVVALSLASIAALVAGIHGMLQPWFYRRQIKVKLAEIRGWGHTPDSYLALIPLDQPARRARAMREMGMTPPAFAVREDRS